MNDVSGAFELHNEMRTKGSYQELGHSCNQCTMKHGTFIKPNFDFGNRTNFSELDNGRYPICASGNQCVSDSERDATGCCQQCEEDQFCISATLSFGGESKAHLWNKCPPGYICDSFASSVTDLVQKCDPGTICQNNKRYDCREVRQAAIDAGYGDIHAGSYCPDGGFVMLFCPQGYYCNSPDMTKKYICPAGYFCPMKTETPYIKCSGCEEGAMELRTNPLLAVGIVSPMICVFILAVLSRMRFQFCPSRRTEENKTDEPKHKIVQKNELQALRMQQDVSMDITNEDLTRSNLNHARILSMVTSIERRVERLCDLSSSNKEVSLDNFDVESSFSEDSKQSSKNSILTHIINIFNKKSPQHSTILSGNFPPREEEKISIYDGVGPDARSFTSMASLDFDAELVFQKLDVNNDGLLSHDELNAILNLDEVKLRFFFRRMNKLDGNPLDTPTISKECFTKHFYETLLNTESFDPDNSEAAEIFDALDTDSNGVIQGMELHTSILENIFTDRQIHVMMKKMIKNNASGKDMIDKDTFIRMYPMLLSEVILNPNMESEHKDDGIDITFSDLSLTVNISGKNENILDSMCGRIQKKTMTALIGGSGAGKTSLLNALCGKASYGKVTGNILINGTNARIEDHKHLMGFVPQDDIMYSELTVRENLLYAGRLKLPSSTSIATIGELADDIIANLGLIKVRDNIVGDVRRRGISGGEKKRVNIGLELMGKPRILFLDEPTSGLDASSSSLVMSSLKSLVRDDGVTVVSIIHQPRKFIFDLIDNVILLGMGGRIVYHGPPSQALSYFQNLGYTLLPGENVADWLSDISSGQLGMPSQNFSDEHSHATLMTTNDLRQNRESLFEKWEDHVASLSETEMELLLLPPEPSPIPPKMGKPSFMAQVWAQTQRNFLVMYRNIYVKLLDAFIIVMAVAVVASIDGPAVLVDKRISHAGPQGLPLSEITLEHPEWLPLNKLFWPFYKASMHVSGEAVKTAVIVAVLVGLNATKVMSEKKIEFFREASSGYSINAYFLAVNITATLEHSLQMVLAGTVNVLFRSSVSSWASFILNFVVLGWGCVSWALFFSVIIPPKNLVLVTGFFMSFFSILFSGSIPPFWYQDIYESNVLILMTGLLAPARFFVETFIVSDFKCMPPQTGFTKTADAISIPRSDMSFSVSMFGDRDEHLADRSCNGWFKYYPAACCIGLTVRLAAGILLHVVNRSQMNQGSIMKSMTKPSTVLSVVLVAGLFIFLFLTSVYLIFH